MMTTCFFSKGVFCVAIALGITAAGCVPADSYQPSRNDIHRIQRAPDTPSIEPVIDSNGGVGRNATGVVYIPKHRCAGDGRWPVGACFVEDQTGKPYWYHDDGQWRPVKPKTVTEDIAEPPTN